MDNNDKAMIASTIKAHMRPILTSDEFGSLRPTWKALILDDAVNECAGAIVELVQRWADAYRKQTRDPS